MEVKTNSPKQTLAVAQKLASEVKPGDVIALFGELGAGKTIFVKGLAQALGVKTKVTSPTFVFLKIYEGKNLTINHIDLYRGESIRSFKDLGLEEIFETDALTIIEWAQRLEKKLPKKRIDVTIKKINETNRRILIKRH